MDPLTEMNVNEQQDECIKQYWGIEMDTLREVCRYILMQKHATRTEKVC